MGCCSFRSQSKPTTKNQRTAPARDVAFLFRMAFISAWQTYGYLVPSTPGGKRGGAVTAAATPPGCGMQGGAGARLAHGRASSGQPRGKPL